MVTLMPYCLNSGTVHHRAVPNHSCRIVIQVDRTFPQHATKHAKKHAYGSVCVIDTTMCIVVMALTTRFV